MTYWPPSFDAELRTFTLGQVASTPLSVLPAVQSIAPAAVGSGTILANVVPSLQQVYPTTPPAAEIVAGTDHPNSTIRFFQGLEGVVDAYFQIQFQDTTAGNAIWTITALNGTLLDTVSQTVLTEVSTGGGSVAQNGFVSAIFRNRALIKPFPGTIGSPARRFIDTAIRVRHDQPGARDIQLRVATAILFRASYQ